MKRNVCMVLFLLSLCLVWGETVTATYDSGDIPTTYGFDSIGEDALEPGILTLAIPGNAEITGVDVSYSMTALGSAWKSEQRSQLRCITTGGEDEAVIHSGTGSSSGTQVYSRTALDIANAVTGVTELTFELHAGRTWGGSGSNTTYNKVDNNTWTITVHYEINDPNAPTIITDINPADGQTNVKTTGSITWNWGINSSTYDLWFGPSGNMVEVVSDAVAGAEGTAGVFAFSELDYLTEYQWQVVISNDNVTDYQCPVYSFETMYEPVSIFPATETFDSFTEAQDATGYADNWSTSPSGTTSLFRWNVDADGTPTYSTGPSSDHSTGSGKYLFTEASSGSTGNEAYLYSPLYDFSSVANPQLSFWYHMYGSNMGSLHLDVSINGGLSWTEDVMTPLSGQQQTSNSDAWLEQDVNLGTYAGENVQVRFRSIRGNGTYGDMAIDDVTMYEGPTTPIFAVNPTDKSFGAQASGSTSQAQTFTISNTGLDGLEIQSVALGGSNADQFLLTDINSYPVPLDNDQSITVDVSFKPTSVGSKSAYISISDNQGREIHQISLSGAGVNIVSIGDGTETSNLYPVNTYGYYNYTQTIYPASFFPEQTINLTSLSYHLAGNGQSNADDWAIYVGTTQDATISTWLDIADFTLVYNGNVGLSSATADEWLVINFDTPFSYDPVHDGNLVIAVDENTPGSSSSMNFYHTSSAETVSRRYFSTGSANPDPSNPPTSSCYNNEIFPNTKIGYENDGGALPVTLSNFTANFINNQTYLSWTTQSENENMGWNIYRSKQDDQSTFSQINPEMISGAGTVTEPTNYNYADVTPVEAGETYCYFLETISLSGQTELFEPIMLTIPQDQQPPVPQTEFITELYNNYPNPFNPETVINFSLKEDEHAEVIIFNSRGQKVRTLVNEQLPADHYAIVWNGTDDAGNPVASGVYFCRMVTSSFCRSKKMLLMK